jgi:integrase
MPQEKKTPKWQKTRTPHLLKNSDSGIYYAILYRDGRQHWLSLKTTSYSVAQSKLADEIKAHRQTVKTAESVKSGKATVATVAQMFLDGEELRQDLKESMKHYRRQCVAAILKTWPELKELQPRAVTEAMCAKWSAGLEYSGTRHNNMIGTLRMAFDLAIQHGLTFRNPAAELSKRQPSKKRLQIPSREEFAKLVETVRTSGAWCQDQAGDLVEFCAYSGARITEAVNVRWSDVEADGIWIHGDHTGTKNRESRRIPIISPMRRLLDDIKANPRHYRQDDRKDAVLAITTCRDALDAACTKLGLPKLGHHDLRHIFASRCIESGIDIPTVARWLGHKDGGVLAMKVYGHLHDQHSQAMARKVVF